MLCMNAVGKIIVFSIMTTMSLFSSVSFANGGSGKGDGDGIFGYQSSSDAKLVRQWCGGRINEADNSPSYATTYNLGACLMEVREIHKHASPYYMRNISVCGMLDIASAEACREHWGLFGINHQSCKLGFTDKIGRREGWFKNFGYCNKSCVAINVGNIFNPGQFINTYPVDTWPCGIKDLPPGVTLIP